MKTIKLIILGLLFSSYSYAQTDTMFVMVGGKDYILFDAYSNIIDRANKFQEGEYKDVKISINNNETLYLYLYDFCSRCDSTITERVVSFVDRFTNKKKYNLFRSSDNVYYIDGKYTSKVIVKKPE